MYVRTYVCMYVRTYVCTYVCMDVCMYVYGRMWKARNAYRILKGIVLVYVHLTFDKQTVWKKEILKDYVYF